MSCREMGWWDTTPNNLYGYVGLKGDLLFPLRSGIYMYGCEYGSNECIIQVDVDMRVSYGL